tara:strand:- start:1558 stop:2130 length:573 start_codon:yes stop_codon:yes gene_type:complete
MDEIKYKSIFLTEKECFTISNFVLKNEQKIKSLGPDCYGGTPDDSLTGRYYLFNYLNVPEINSILKPKLQNLFAELDLVPEIYVQCWANTFRKGDYIDPHRHAGESEEFLSANIFLKGRVEPGTTYHTDTGLVDLKNTVGELVLFDSSTVHSVKEYQYDDIRVTLAMDIHYGVGNMRFIFKNHPERYYKF